MSGGISVGVALGATALAASDVAAVGLTVGTVMEATAAVGATVGAVGALTGNKTLQLGGMALGAVGGIGSIAAGAGMFGADALGGVTAGAAAGSGAGGAFTGADAASMAGATGLDVAPVSDMAGTMTAASGPGTITDILSSITGTTPPAGMMPADQFSTSAGPTDQSGQPISQGDASGDTTLGTQGNPAAAQPAGGMVNASATSPAAPPATPDTSGSPPPAATGAPSTAPTATTAKPGSSQPTTPAPGTWDAIMKFIEAHPALALGGVSAASSFLSGAFNPKTPAEVGALNAQAAKNTADVGLINTQARNINAPLPTATRTRTNTGVGLINRSVA